VIITKSVEELINKGVFNMIILYLLGFMSLIAGIFAVIAICTHDYTKDEKGKDIKEKIDHYLLKP